MALAHAELAAGLTTHRFDRRQCGLPSASPSPWTASVGIRRTRLSAVSASAEGSRSSTRASTGLFDSVGDVMSAGRLVTCLPSTSVDDGELPPGSGGECAAGAGAREALGFPVSPPPRRRGVPSGRA